MCLDKYLMQISTRGQLVTGTVPPVIKVTGHHDRRLRRNVGMYELAQAVHLQGAVGLNQAQVNTDGVQIDAATGYLQFAMQ